MRVPLATVVSLALGGVVLTGCASQQASPQTPSDASASAELLDGTAPCDEAAFAETVGGVIAPGEQVESIDNFGCDSGWAFAFVSVGPADGSAEGVYTMTMVFEAEGQFWIPKDQMDVCGTPPTGSSQPAAPADALVPAAIWQQACWTN